MKIPRPHFRGPRPSARSLALQVLLDCARHEAFIQEVLDRHLGSGSAGAALSPADRRLATQLAYGVLRRRATLLALLRPLVDRPPDQVEPWLWDVLCLGAYQLALLAAIPPHAALHETVELAALFGRPGAKGFLNGVLRACAALLTAEPAEGPAADALPLEGGRYRKLARPVLPDPAAEPLEYLSRAFSLPRWLVRRWRERHGEEECRRLGFWFAGPGPLTLRANPLRCPRERLLSALAQAGLAAEPGAHPQAVRLREHAAVRDVPGYEQGWFSVQDESAMRVGSALAPGPGAAVLDLCAAPGGKTTHLAELLRDEGRIVACDIDPRRLETVAGLAGRLGLKSVTTRLLDPRRPGDVPAGPFDAALVDVPCSNTGVLGRRPEARWRLRPEDLQHLVPLQTHLLKLALERVRPGGVVVYSTCSIEPEENEGVVRAALAEVPGVVLEAAEAAVPGRPADGGSWARLRKGAASAEGGGDGDAGAGAGALPGLHRPGDDLPG
jgi:16S rRNA (cytosine967-C5)-methyltransferase